MVNGNNDRPRDGLIDARKSAVQEKKGYKARIVQGVLYKE